MATDIQTIDFSVDLLQVLLWKDNKAVNVAALLEAKQAWYNVEQTAFWTNWIVDVFDLRTCNDFGLIVWAIILGLPLTYFLPGNNTPVAALGFGPDGGTGNNGNLNAFYSNFAATAGESFNFTQDEKRILLKLRYRQMIARATVPETNRILKDILVPVYGPMWMIDNYNMTQTFHVASTTIPAFLSFILTQFDIIPRPSGVQMLVSHA